MRNALLTIAAVGSVLGALECSAQFSFGPWSTTPADASTLSPLGPFDDPPILKLTTSFNVSGTLTPNVGSDPGLTTYHVSYSSIVIHIYGVDGLFNEYNRDVELGPVDFSTDVLVTEANRGTAIPVTVAPSEKTLFLDLLAGMAGQDVDFTVSWTSVSLPLATGGKGVVWDTKSLSGGIAVPEPGHLGFLAGLGLLGFSGWRRARR